MNQNGFSTQDLNVLQEQLSVWRGRHSGHRRLPEALWAAAGSVARNQGVSRVARVLRLDYYTLKARAAEPGAAVPVPSPSPSPRFVELQVEPCPGTALGGCRAELYAADGARLALHLPGDSNTVLALAQAFWRRGQ
jgi:hypothetical protein